MQLFAVDKPLGLTSHDVVARARRLLGTRKVGHAGTLDPLATGVVLVMANEATKLSSYLTGHDKTYLAWVTLGATTPTLDAEGPVTRVADAARVSPEALRSVLPPFLAMKTQRPPAFSAVKRAGVRSYAAARKGVVEEPPARSVSYEEVELLALAADPAGLPVSFARPSQAPPGRWEPMEGGRAFDLPPAPEPAEGVDMAGGRRYALFRLKVGAGTYVRSFARDLGTALGLPAYLSGLVRTASGAVDLAAATDLGDIGQAGEVDAIMALELPTLTLTTEQVADVRHGRRPYLSVAGRTALLAGDGTLVALAESAEGRQGYRLLRVFN